jgi:GntR family transcriptional repressor for pyruvate dehydrogenase complex
VADVLGSAFSPALIRLFAAHEEAVFDYIAFRRDLESIAAARAATYGSDTDLKVIQAVFDKMEAAHSKRNPADEAELDAEFHLAIIEASHNVILLHMMRSTFDLLARGRLLQPPDHVQEPHHARSAALEHHRAINDALQARDPDAAREAVVTHLSFIEQALEAQKKAEANEAVAQLRYAQEQDR